MKYNHPAITEGKLDCDKLFYAHIDAALNSTRNADLDFIIDTMLKQCDDIKSPGNNSKHKKHYVIFNEAQFDFSEIDPQLAERIQQLINTPKKTQYYLWKPWKDGIPTLNENDPANSTYPDKQTQLLAVARFWN